MSKLKELFSELNLSPGHVAELSGCVNNPFLAMQKVQELGIPLDFFQRAFEIMSSDPDAFMDLASDLGLPEEAANRAKATLDSFMGR